MSRQAYVDHTQKFILFWSPKAGCSSLVNWFSRGSLANSGQYPTPAPKEDPRTWLSNNGYQLDHKQAYNLALNAGYETFVLARHPVPRLISAYLNKFVKHPKRIHTSFQSLEAFARQCYVKAKATENQNAIKNYEGLSFLEFVHYINDEIQNKKQLEPKLNNHWNTQFPFWLKNKKFAYDNIFYLEDMAATKAWLNSRVEIERKFPKNNVTKYGDGFRQDCTNMSSLELTENMGLLSQENFITSEISSLLAEAFELDYTTFGYDPYDLAYIPPPTSKGSVALTHFEIA